MDTRRACNMTLRATETFTLESKKQQQNLFQKGGGLSFWPERDLFPEDGGGGGSPLTNTATRRRRPQLCVGGGRWRSLHLLEDVVGKQCQSFTRKNKLSSDSCRLAQKDGNIQWCILYQRQQKFFSTQKILQSSTT